MQQTILIFTLVGWNTLFFQSALGCQSAVETKSPNQGQSATTGVQSATEEGQIETWESQFHIAKMSKK